MVFGRRIRNIQIFGMGNSIPRLRYLLILIVLAVSAFIVFKFAAQDSALEVTGMAVSTEEEPQLPQESKEAESQPEEDQYGWWEYKEQCSFDIRNAEDDVNDIKSYMNNYQSEHDKLESEYNQKIKELDDQYKGQLQALQENIKEAQSSLDKAQAKLDEFRSQCAY